MFVTNCAIVLQFSLTGYYSYVYCSNSVLTSTENAEPQEVIGSNYVTFVFIAIINIHAQHSKKPGLVGIQLQECN